MEPPLYTYQRVWGLPWPMIIRQIHPDVKPDEFIHAYAKMHSSETTQEVKDMRQTIWTLAKQGYTLGVLSSKPSASLNSRLVFFDIKKHFTVAYGAEDSAHHKPDPRAFSEPLQALRTHYTTPNEILYVGDLVIDAIAARGVGIQFVGVLTGPTTRIELLDAGVTADNILESVRALPSWLEKYHA